VLPWKFKIVIGENHKLKLEVLTHDTRMYFLLILSNTRDVRRRCSQSFCERNLFPNM